jgi:gluconolactonase
MPERSIQGGDVGFEVVTEDTGLGEGPVWCPADGTVVLTSVDRGVLYRVWPDSGRKEVVGDTAGSPNAAQLASDGGFVVTQAGGHDLSSFSPERPHEPDATVFYTVPETPRPTPPGLQRVTPEGTVTYLARDGFQAPNDLVVARDGTIYFTDPPELVGDNREQLLGRVWAYRTDGSMEVVAERFSYCNGIALDIDGSIIVVERSGLQRVYTDGTKEWVIEVMGEGTGDGFCLDRDGRIYVAFNRMRGVKVIEHGKEVDFLAVSEASPGIVTNVCFGGADLRTLYLTDAFAGRLLAWEAMPTPGLPLTAWPVPVAGL